MMNDGQHWFGGGFMWVIWILIILAIIWGIKEVTTSSNKPGGKQQTALDILKERYARGDITHQEFEQKKKDLEG